MCFVYEVYEMIKYLFFSRHFILEGGWVLDLIKCIVPWQMCFVWSVILD